MNSKVLNKLEAGKTYRLIDKEGYLASDEANCLIIDEYFVEGEVTLEKVESNGDGIIGCGLAIREDEMQYFELVGGVALPVKECVQLWNGVSPLIIGDIVTKVNSHNAKLVVELIKGDQVVLTNENGYLSVLMLDNINSLLPSPKEQFCDLMLNKVRSQSLDFAYDTSWDIKELSRWCYEELMGGE